MATKKQVRDEIDRRAAENERTLPPILSAPPFNASQKLLDVLKAEIRVRYLTFSIALHFPNFYRWLASIPDPSGTFVDLGAAVMAFGQARDRYLDPQGPVTKVLDQINARRSGQALLTAITTSAAANFVHIIPDLIFRLTGTPSADADIVDIPTARHVTAVGMPILDPDRSKPWTGLVDVNGNFVGSGEGTRLDPGTGKEIHGDDSFVEFSPEAFVSGSPSRPAGPGMEPDEVLFHELVHASRQVIGAVYFMPVNQNYDNEEEYLAIVLSNIYIRNKNRGAALRGDHDQSILREPDRFLDNVQRVDLEPRMLLERFRLWQLSLFNDLAGIAASVTPFNPVRQYKEELDAGKAAAGALKRRP